MHAVLGKYNNNKKKLKTNYEKGQLQNEKTSQKERKKKVQYRKISYCCSAVASKAILKNGGKSY